MKCNTYLVIIWKNLLFYPGGVSIGNCVIVQYLCSYHRYHFFCVIYCKQFQINDFLHLKKNFSVFCSPCLRVLLKYLQSQLLQYCFQVYGYIVSNCVQLKLYTVEFNISDFVVNSSTQYHITSHSSLLIKVTISLNSIHKKIYIYISKPPSNVKLVLLLRNTY